MSEKLGKGRLPSVKDKYEAVVEAAAKLAEHAAEKGRVKEPKRKKKNA